MNLLTSPQLDLKWLITGISTAIAALQRLIRAVATTILIATYLLTTVVVPPAWAEQVSTDLGSSVTQTIPTVVHNGVTLPDWSKISFNSLPTFSESGAVQIPPNLASQIGFDPSTSWQAGAHVSDVLKAGTLTDMGVGDMSIQHIDQALQQSGTLGSALGSATSAGGLVNAASGAVPGLPANLSDLSLATFTPVGSQTISSLAAVVPGLPQQLVSNIKPIAALVTSGLNGGLNPNQIGTALGDATGLDIPLGELLSQMPDLGNLSMSNLNLSDYSISSIPGLDTIPVKDLPDWQNAYLKGIPGLADLPLTQMPGFSGESSTPFVARMDVPLDDAEGKREQTVSGSFQAGFRVPCDTDKTCAHAELSPIAGSQMDVASQGSFANGRAWISGKSQLVKGGTGVLSAINGGKEPTGRNPYGSVFKQVITKLDQPGGKVETSLYFRFCKHGVPDLGCSPYFIGPIPFLTYPEKMFVYLGFANPKDDGKGISVGGDPLRGNDGFCSNGAALSGDAVDRATLAVDKVASSVGDGRFHTSSSNASAHIPRILAALKAEGITCPAQVAYVLATVQGETSWVNFEEQGATGNYGYLSSGASAHGRGYLQTTWADGYEHVKQEFGVDVVAHPELLSTDTDLMAKVLARGFAKGWYGNRQPIAEAIPCNGQVDYVSARQMINDNAQSQTFAQAATVFYDALSSGEGLDKATTTETKPSGCGGSETSPGKPSPEGWFDPLPGGSETAPWGQYVHSGHFHNGSDLAKGGIGVPIYAARDGRVDGTGPGNCADNGDGCGNGYGNWISITHDNGYSTFYGHNHRMLVRAGDQVKGGQQISEQGSSGFSTGPHLHFEVCPSSGGCGQGTRVAPSKVGIPHPFSKQCENNSPGSPSYCDSW